MAETVEQRRARLIARDPIAVLIQTFVDSDMQELEVVAAEDGQVVDGIKFIETKDTTPVRLHSRLYTIALRMGYLKSEVWVNKKGRSVWLRKYDPKAVTE